VIAETPPPVVIVAAPVSSRDVMVWGDPAAMEAIRKTFEAENWRWAKLLLGGRTDALLLMPPASVSDDEIARLVDDINLGKFGKLSAGYAQIGSPPTHQKSS
jgi:hypothetical protein